VSGFNTLQIKSKYEQLTVAKFLPHWWHLACFSRSQMTEFFLSAKAAIYWVNNSKKPFKLFGSDPNLWSFAFFFFLWKLNFRMNEKPWYLQVGWVSRLLLRNHNLLILKDGFPFVLVPTVVWFANIWSLRLLSWCVMAWFCTAFFSWKIVRCLLDNVVFLHSQTKRLVWESGRNWN